MSEPESPVEALFDRVVDLPPAERAAILDNYEEAGVAELVRALLDGEAHAPTEFLAGQTPPTQPFGDTTEPTAMADSAVPDRIGGYRIIRRIGEGGMGSVFEAEQESPSRRVALKMIRSDLPSPELLKRFQNEAQVLGYLQHPGIASIHEAGQAESSGVPRPFLAMEYVDGLPLKEYVTSHGLLLRERLELLARVCDAVQHAHQKGVIHRDLKPANILVVRHVQTAAGDSSRSSLRGVHADNIGQPKVLDFGIARITDADLATVTMQTGVGQLIGTLAYMSPEQVTGDSADLDVRCDVYALGAVLYELLSGVLPHDLGNLSIVEAARVIREEQPTTLRSRLRAIPHDVETIVAKAMEKDRDRRYASAAALGSDLRRYLADEPIEARPASMVYHARKFARRHRALVGGAAATFVALIIGLYGTYVQMQRAIRTQDRLKEIVRFQADTLSGLNARYVGRGLISDLKREFEKGLSTLQLSDDEKAAKVAEFEQLLEHVNGTNLAREILDGTIAARAKRRLDEGFTDDPLTIAELRSSVGVIYQGLGLYERAIEQFTQALALCRQHAHDRDRLTLKTKSRLGRAYLTAGRLGEAEPLLVEAVSGFQELGDREVFESLNRLAGAYIRSGRLDAAEACSREVIKRGTATLGPEHDYVVGAKVELGVILHRRGEIDAALELMAETVELRRRTRGENSSSTITARNNLMATLFRANRLAEAEEQARAIAKSYAKSKGDDHPLTIMAHNNIGRILLDTDRAAESLELFEKVYRLSQAKLPPSHEVRRKGISNLIDALAVLERHSEAEPFSKQLLEECRALDPQNPVEISNALEQHGISLAAQAKHAEAGRAFAESVALREGVNAEHWLTHWARSLLGATLIDLGRSDEAQSLIAPSLEALEKVAETIPVQRRDRVLEAARAHARRLAATD